MGLNPSCNLKEGLKGFKNLGDPPFTAVPKNWALMELLEAGTPRGAAEYTTKEVEVYEPGSEADKMSRSGIWMPGMAKDSPTIWIEVHQVSAKAFGWTFRRAWYYWVCSAETHGYGLPEAAAKQLNEEHRLDVRVDGYASGQEVHGEVDSYHVDTPDGLKALVEVLKQNYEIKEALYRKERDARYGPP